MRSLKCVLQQGGAEPATGAGREVWEEHMERYLSCSVKRTNQ